ncbi:hypothetical protein DFJ74DRAFT_664221 [Hyaloraphidium curvatum]|nr:hypothetical protein DFJ74DRAFT_664221 [Hyaloraphidium curvatum]
MSLAHRNRSRSGGGVAGSQGEARAACSRTAEARRRARRERRAARNACLSASGTPMPSINASDFAAVSGSSGSHACGWKPISPHPGRYASNRQPRSSLAASSSRVAASSIAARGTASSIASAYAGPERNSPRPPCASGATTREGWTTAVGKRAGRRAGRSAGGMRVGEASMLGARRLFGRVASCGEAGCGGGRMDAVPRRSRAGRHPIAETLDRGLQSITRTCAAGNLLELWPPRRPVPRRRWRRFVVGGE